MKARPARDLPIRPTRVTPDISLLRHTAHRVKKNKESLPMQKISNDIPILEILPINSSTHHTIEIITAAPVIDPPRVETPVAPIIDSPREEIPVAPAVVKPKEEPPDAPAVVKPKEEPPVAPAVVKPKEETPVAPAVIKPTVEAVKKYIYSPPQEIERNKPILLHFNNGKILCDTFTTIAIKVDSSTTQLDIESNTLTINEGDSLSHAIRILLKQFPTTPGIYFDISSDTTNTLPSGIDKLYHETTTGFWLSIYAVKILLGVYSRRIFTTTTVPSCNDIRALLSNHGIITDANESLTPPTHPNSAQHDESTCSNGSNVCRQDL